MPKWTAAGKRFDRITFGSKHDWSTHPTTTYTCPSCHGTTELALQDFDTHAQAKDSVLVDEDAAELFTELPEVMHGWGNSLLPFHCSRCAGRVLLVYDTNESHANGRLHFLHWVIEAVAA
jgi:hypothetical protein